MVAGEYGKKFEDTYKKVKRDIKRKTQNYKINTVKIDLAKITKEISLQEFETEIEQMSNKNAYKNGIILDYDNKKDIILIDAEINSNYIINYSDNKIDIDKLNTYLEYRGEKKVENLPEKIKIFTTTAYFCDKDNTLYELYNDDTNIARRKIDTLKTDEIEEILENSCNYLTNMLQTNGQFVYGYSALLNQKLEGYNIVRHEQFGY